MFVPTCFCSVAFLPAELAGVLTFPTCVDFCADSTLVLLLLWVLLSLGDLVDPVGLLQGALLGYIVCLLAQDVGGDLLQRSYVRLEAHLFNKMGFNPVAERV